MVQTCRRNVKPTYELLDCRQNGPSETPAAVWHCRGSFGCRLPLFGSIQVGCYVIVITHNANGRVSV
jgi:hypothetical protein